MIFNVCHLDDDTPLKLNRWNLKNFPLDVKKEHHLPSKPPQHLDSKCEFSMANLLDGTSLKFNSSPQKNIQNPTGKYIVL